MLAVHAFWSGDRLCLWGEDSEAETTSPSQALTKARPHPFAAQVEVLREVLGLGAGSLPLTLRFSPMIGGVLYWLRPGTVRQPPWPDRVPGTRGNSRTPLDVLLYAGLLAALIYLLVAGERPGGDFTGDAAALGGHLAPAAVAAASSSSDRTSVPRHRRIASFGSAGSSSTLEGPGRRGVSSPMPAVTCPNTPSAARHGQSAFNAK